jgi:hypothetical protein
MVLTTEVLHVTQEALMLNSSPWKNLLFGCPDTSLVDANRVRLILDMMEMKGTLSLIEEDLLRHAKGAEGEESPKNSNTYEESGQQDLGNFVRLLGRFQFPTLGRQGS